MEKKQDKFIEKILENISKVKISEWENYVKEAPTNLFTGKNYKGFNILALYLDTLINDFSSSKYATFNSISKAGGKLKKGAKGCIIEFFNVSFRDKETNKIVPNEKVKNLSKEDLDKLKHIVTVKNYTVFNSHWIENIEEINLSVNDLTEQEDEEIHSSEEFISKLKQKGLNLKYSISPVAFYNPILDYINIPKKELFISKSKYYSTIFHEIIHWTGHKSRLNRIGIEENSKEKYSFEELVAEQGAMLLCFQFGIKGEFVNSLRYLKGWLKYNTEAPSKVLRKAFSESKKAKKYLENI
ncbi:zincin-like metallopeptidase domain-containing protein [Riemerella anatipestifer]|uniref:zincin-like metallopeptidase domain-containing protein n=1 Tax=Riemerella anatipestifer TaxID=34085 RepID=UPI00129D7ABB|nr:zincin-like metallopeptidase domain-containing protein [Riemerella anatipestifer]MRM84288.1 DUF1738 domain-containing protein [Riemerella anatipestifer]